MGIYCTLYVQQKIDETKWEQVHDEPLYLSSTIYHIMFGINEHKSDLQNIEPIFKQIIPDDLIYKDPDPMEEFYNPDNVKYKNIYISCLYDTSIYTVTEDEIKNIKYDSIIDSYIDDLKDHIKQYMDTNIETRFIFCFA